MEMVIERDVEIWMGMGMEMELMVVMVIKMEMGTLSKARPPIASLRSFVKAEALKGIV